MASLLQRSGSPFESSIRGASMEPTLPDGSRIRIGPPPDGRYQPGQIIACVSGESIFAHRIVHCARDRMGELVLTQGDGWLLCDPPTRRERILGAVTEYSQGGDWRVPAGPLRRDGWRAAVAAGSLWLVRASLPVHAGFARRVAGTMLIIGSLCKRLSSIGAGHGKL